MLKPLRYTINYNSNKSNLIYSIFSKLTNWTNILHLITLKLNLINNFGYCHQWIKQIQKDKRKSKNNKHFIVYLLHIISKEIICYVMMILLKIEFMHFLIIYKTMIQLILYFLIKMLIRKWKEFKLRKIL